MKKIILIIIINFSFSWIVQAQWIQNGSHIYTNNNVGIAIETPASNLHIFENSTSVPGGVVAPTKSILKLSRLGTLNYSYNESAEFRLGHGGPSVWGSRLDLYINGGSNQFNIPDQQVMSWLYDGSVGIGTAETKGYKFAVNGSAIATSVTVKLNSAWPDYVFKKDYSLTPLSEVKSFINTNKHLAGIPTEQEVINNGLDLGEMNKLLLKKVEELTLYLIESHDKNIQQQAQIDQLKEQVGLLLKK